MKSRGESATSRESRESPEIPFDNSYRWLWASMEKLMDDPVAARRPHYIWGTLQGIALGKVLGIDRLSVIEVGVAGGAGLLALERVVELCEELVSVKIEIYGFDTGAGMPKPKDYRDMPYKWSEGYYPCDMTELSNRLRRSELRVGLLKDTMPAFVAQRHAPVAFVGFDVCMYSATRDALLVFESAHASLIPRVPCSFRSAIGKDMSEYGGELLAIAEFNRSNAMRKLSPIRGVQYFVPARYRWWWVDMLYSLHIFDHPHYADPDAYKLSAVIDLDDNEEFHAAEKSLLRVSGESE